MKSSTIYEIEALTQSDKHIVLALNYIHTHTPNFQKLESSMVKLIAKLVETTAQNG